MPGYEFEIEVSGGMVSGRYGPVGGQRDPAGRGPVVEDPLALETACLLEDWLNQWDRIDRVETLRSDQILSPKAFRVIGQQLWKLLLSNQVGDALIQRLTEPNDGQPLRVLINFRDGVDPQLQGLPWEFLFCPQLGIFVGTETRLLLTRYVSLPLGRTRVEVTHDKLNVLLIVTVPDNPRFASAGGQVLELTLGLREVVGVEVVPPVTAWDPAQIEQTLRETPCHIVHIVGACRGTPGHPEIFLGGPNGSGWRDPEPLVEALTGAGSKRPELVILQLCEDSDGDASENFERLAPALMVRQIPAVLAMQYPVSREDTRTVGIEFYKRLVGGSSIGEAVQYSRAAYRRGKLDRRFGAPVLYLQDDGALVPRPQAAAQLTVGQPVEPSTRAVAVTGAVIRRALLNEIGIMAPDGETELRLTEWVNSIAWPDDGAEAWRIVRRQSQFDVDGADVRSVYAAMSRAVRGL